MRHTALSSLSRELKAEVVRLYRDESLSGDSIVSRLGRAVSRRTVRRVLDDAGAHVRSRSEAQACRDHPPRFSEEQEQAICREYEGGARLHEVTARHHSDKRTIGEVLARRGVARRTRGDSLALPVNHGAFDVLTEAAQYWVGVLMADGCVTRNDSTQAGLVVALGMIDREHVEAFRDFVSAEHLIGVRPRPAPSRTLYTLRFRSDRMAASLARLGIVPRKSLVARAPAELASSPHFWRGMVDGDGTIGFHKSRSGIYCRLSLCGSRACVGQFGDFARSLDPPARAVPRARGSISEVVFGASTALRLARALYQDSPVSLARKQAVAEQMFARCDPAAGRLLADGEPVPDDPRITWRGETRRAEQWAVIVGIGATVIRRRLSIGWTVEDALTTPPYARSPNDRLLTLDGRTQRLRQWASDFGINEGTIRKRIDRLGWTVEDAVTTPLRGAPCR